MNKGIQKPDNTHTDEGEKAPKGQLRTQTYGIIKRKLTSRRTFTCIDCGTKRKSKQDINRHYREKHSQGTRSVLTLILRNHEMQDR